MNGRLHTRLCTRIAIIALAATLTGGATPAEDAFRTGTPKIQSMSVLAFGPDGVLFVGDGKGGAVFAIRTGDTEVRDATDAINIRDIEQKLAARLGARAVDVMIHDMAVNPASQNIYFTVSRSRGEWDSRWLLPNDVADATVLLRLRTDGMIEEVFLTDVPHARAALPNPVASDKSHLWKDGVSMRADTITDIAFAGDTVWVTGLSNEEFASTAWRIPWPFEDHVTATTLEVFHGAHGEYETHAPIRTFVPFSIKNDQQLLAAYLCTPLVTFPTDDLKDGQHVKGRTVAELGSGNYPLDMILYEKEGEDWLLIANSNLPFMVINPDEVAAYEGSITEEVEGYLAGVSYEPRSGVGILQMDLLNPKFVVALQRLPGGTMDLVSLPVDRF